MKFNDLQINSHRAAKRLGRGISAGQGKTAGRGTKGQKARTGSSRKPGFSGGQNPLMQQLPKLPGFRSQHLKAENVTTADIQSISAKVIDAQVLANNKLISNAYVKVKLLNKGELKTAKTVKLPSASQSAIDNLQKAGGSFEKVSRLQRSKKISKVAQ